MSIEPGWEDRPTPYTSAVLLVVLGMVGAFGYGGPLGFVIPAALGGLLLAPLALRFRWPPVEWLVLALLVAWVAVTMLWSPARPEAAPSSYEDWEQLTALKLALQLGALRVARGRRGQGVGGGRPAGACGPWWPC
jgi:hypothetical protein